MTDYGTELLKRQLIGEYVVQRIRRALRGMNDGVILLTITPSIHRSHPYPLSTTYAMST
jgi:hypothetical protein